MTLDAHVHTHVHDVCCTCSFKPAACWLGCMRVIIAALATIALQCRRPLWQHFVHSLLLSVWFAGDHEVRAHFQGRRNNTVAAYSGKGKTVLQSLDVAFWPTSAMAWDRTSGNFFFFFDRCLSGGLLGQARFARTSQISSRQENERMVRSTKSFEIRIFRLVDA